MSKCNYLESKILRLLFLGEEIPGLAVNDTTTPLTNLWLALFYGDPGEAGALTQEMDYTGYARVAVARSGAGFTEASGKLELMGHADFPKMTGGVARTVTHWGVCDAASAGNLLYHGTVNPNLPISTSYTPRLEGGAGLTNITED